VLEEAEEYFTCRGRIGQNTQELDCVVQLLIKIREQLANQKPLQTATILDLTRTMWCGKNWQSLPEPLNERRTTLDGVLREIGLARERPMIGVVGSRSYSLAKAAQGYVANEWMHTRWMARILASDMLLNLQSALKNREKQLTRWWRNPYALVVAGVLLAYVAMPFGIALCIAGVVGYVAQFRNLSTQSKLERIINEVQSDFYSGRVLADRLEELNRSRCDVPSILTEVLRSG
jgi:HAMP domain-containing protein